MQMCLLTQRWRLQFADLFHDLPLAHKLLSIRLEFFWENTLISFKNPEGLKTGTWKKNPITDFSGMSASVTWALFLPSLF